MKKSSNHIFNEEQQKAIFFGEGPLLIVAGAGTGKTTVITERIRHLILHQHVDPQHILALTFTEKASREMEERIDRALPYGMTQMWISTFHSFCDRVLKREGIHIGLQPRYTLMNEAESTLFFRQRLFEFNLEYFRPLGNPTKFIGGMLEHFSRLQDEDITPDEYIQWVRNKQKEHKSKTPDNKEIEEELRTYDELSRAYATYQKLKMIEGKMDYGDLISLTIALFRQRPHILQRYQEQFQCVLIDEFQDTNYAQNQLMLLLAGERKNITVVGDDDQSIYKWRGAAISNMIRFREYYPEATLVVLTKNYRSTKEILDRSYDLIQYNNPHRLEITEHIDKKLESMRRVHGDQIRFFFADRVEDEADAVVKEIQAYIQKDGGRYNDVAILVRANNHSLPFARAFERAGIPYQFLGPGQLLRQPEIKDLIAYLTVLSHIDDTVAFYRVLTMDWLDIEVKDVASIVSYAKKQGASLFEVCTRVLKQRTAEEQGVKADIKIYDSTSYEKIDKLVAMIEKHLSLIRKESAGQILYYFLDTSGMLSRLIEFKTERDEQIANNIAAFFDRLKTFETEHEDTSVFAVVDWISLSLELGDSPLAANLDWSRNNAVTILTVHSSKGLEFPVVFIVNLAAQRFPSIERKDQIPLPSDIGKDIVTPGDHHIEEERRLFYVAMTRAKNRLYLTAAKYYGEGKREKKLSPFIAEALGLEAVEQAEAQPYGETKQLTLLDWAPKPTPDVQKKDQHSLYLSYSQIDAFLTCELQYKYRYVIKLPVPQSAALSFGDTIHKTLERFYQMVQQGGQPTVEDILDLYTSSWRSVGYGQKTYEAKMKAHGEQLLRGFYKDGYVPGVIPKKLEETFRLKITPAITLGGKIDRVDMKEKGKVEIIDYKTGQSTRMKKNINTDLQLSVYAMAAADQGVYGYKVDDVIVSFYFLESQEKISGTRTAEQIEKAREKIIETAQRIQSSTYLANPGKHCDFCEFRLLCEAWQ
jgi:DNA helicase II / ATP-dependent DNA helicase PcrA